uniref:PLA2c domain-containing protein n=1 Tax=Echeneis naucrates TaxID=173247 RepID=A0A665U0R1_ECHNA
MYLMLPNVTRETLRDQHAENQRDMTTKNFFKCTILFSFLFDSEGCFFDSVPHIALLGSGGGQRAAVGLVGSLYQMKKDGLLDTLLYLGGVSGSTWSMSSLYSDPQWSTNMNTAVSKLSGPGVELEQALGWLIERAKEEHFSLTDVWGALTSAAFMKQMDLRHLSDDAGQNATNPYPIYSAIENSFSDGPIEGKWFEMSPHESGFPEMGLFIETSLLGSKFQDGRLLEKKPEMDMVKLQGLCGSISFNIIHSCFQLIDAGLFINVSYPSFLGDKRDIDLIIAPEFSAGNMFEALDYAAEVNKPFPKIDDKVLEERDWPKDCYVFEGKDKEPTIVYLPLFNRKNCKGLFHKHTLKERGTRIFWRIFLLYRFTAYIVNDLSFVPASSMTFLSTLS